MMRVWLTMCVWVLLTVSASAQVSTNGMTLPNTSGDILHVFIAPRIADLRARYNANPSLYPMSYSSALPTTCVTGALNNQFCGAAASLQAFVYQMQTTPRTCGGTVTGALDTCVEAKRWITDCLAAYGTAACWQYNDTDGERYYGEYVILTVIWLWDEWTPTERSDLTTWINRTVAAGLDDSFGSGRGTNGYEDIISNYNWGRYRNALEWGIASRQLSGITMTAVAPCSWASGHFTVNWCGVNQTTVAEALITEAVTRINNLNTWMDTHRGGVWVDGAQYGQYLGDYSSTPFAIANDYGVDFLNASSWWVDAAWRLLYTTSPKATYHRTSTGAFVYQCDSFGATNLSSGRCQPATGSLVGSLTSYMLVRWAGTALEPYLRYWHTNRVPLVHPWMRAHDANLGAAGIDIETAGAAGTYPLDAWAVGSGRLVTRNTWTDTASPKLFYLNLGGSLGHHLNKDAGGFQIMVCGTAATNDCYWVTKEASCYGLSAAANDLPRTDGTYVGAPYGCLWQWGQNVVAVNHADTFSGLDTEPPVVRLDRKADYVVASVDLDAYMGTVPVTAHVRTFVYLRALNTLIKLDRSQVSSTSVPLVDMLRCSINFTHPATHHHRCTMGGVAILDTFQLSGSINGQSVANNERNETGATWCNGVATNCDPQYREEMTVTGCTNCYIVSVHHARTSTETAMSTPTISYTGGVITVGVTVGAATATVTFPDGTTDGGCTIALNGGGATACEDGVDTVASSTASYAWGEGDPGPEPEPPANPRRFRILRRR